MALQSDVATGAPAPLYPPDAETRPDYDMVDGPERPLLAGSKALSTALDFLDAKLTAAYRRADQQALRHQWWHRGLAAAAASFGTVAVVLAILQLTVEAFHHTRGRWIRGSEPVAAALAFFAVILGLSLKLHKGWLVDRHRAQRYRLAKFRLLGDGRLWCGHLDEWRRAVVDSASQIGALDAESVEKRALHDRASDPPIDLAACIIPAPDMDALVAYYGSKRINCQRKYFCDRAERFSRREHLLRAVGPVLFFASVFAALTHFVLEWATGGDASKEFWRWTSLSLIALAAALPALAAGIRTYRGAYEFARSAALFEAKASAMEDFAKRIERARGNIPAVLGIIWQCEDFLEGENLEWLRLMGEAEFYG
jgi:hypothetical protein